MSWAKYARTQHPVPYVIEIEAAQGKLLYFGAKHMGEGVGRPTDPQITLLENEWNRFAPTHVMYEGRSSFGQKLPSLSEAAAKAGEGGALRFLAARDGVAAESLEPTNEEEVGALLHWYSIEQLRVYYMLRCVAQRCTGPGTAEEQVSRWLAGAKGRSEIAGEPDSILAVDHAVQHLLPRLGDWRAASKAWFDPKPAGPETFLNEISRRSNAVRDPHMVRALVDAVRSGQRVLAVVGASHVVMQERALGAALRPASIRHLNKD